MNKKTGSDDVNYSESLKSYKQIIDTDIIQYCQRAIKNTQKEYGNYPAEVVCVFCEQISRGGKRLRGTLTMVSYEMFGGTKKDVALQAARAIEMLHSYILIIDDIQDQSDLRRGAKTAHVTLKNYHEENDLRGDSDQFGESIAINAALYGAHNAINVIADLRIDADIKIAAIKNVNRHFITTAHGQTMDIFNSAMSQASESDIEKTMVWKTAYYTFMSPMQLGAILAGASENQMKFIEEFSIHAGKAFQLRDDILGTFGNQKTTGKRSGEDIIEGKKTLLFQKALELCSFQDRKKLEALFGKNMLTKNELSTCRIIMENCLAKDFVQKLADEEAERAIRIIEEDDNISNLQKKYLKTFVQSII